VSFPTRVLDSWPIVEWIGGREPARAVVRTLLEEAEAGRAVLLMSAINVGEIYYVLRKNHSQELAELWRKRSQTLPFTIETPTTEEIWAAALLKANYAISYADAFAATLAQKHGCRLLTGDPEFRAVAGLELDWLEK
jgi:predicted nucleic acid-binding protein